MPELNLSFLPDGRVVIPARGDPAASSYPVGWSRQYLAADIGRNDPSALVLIKDTCLPMRAATGALVLGPRDRTVIWTDRLQATDFTELAAYIARLMARREFANTALAIDATGMGMPFCDILTQGGVEHFAVTMTAGASINRKGHRVTISKSLLLEMLASAFETGDLTIASDLPGREQLVREISSFELATTASGNLVLEGGGKGHHADLAVACALAWLASEKLSGGTFSAVRLENYF